MPTPKQMEKLAAAVGRKAPPARGLAPDDDCRPNTGRRSWTTRSRRRQSRARRSRCPDAAAEPKFLSIF